MRGGLMDIPFRLHGVSLSGLSHRWLPGKFLRLRLSGDAVQQTATVTRRFGEYPANAEMAASFFHIGAQIVRLSCHVRCCMGAGLHGGLKLGHTGVEIFQKAGAGCLIGLGIGPAG